MKQQIKNSRVVGIDLGTSYTVMAFYDDTGKPKVLPNIDGDFKTASIIYIGPKCKEILVGASAHNMMMVEPKRTLKEFKRDVGTNTVYFTENKQKITPEWCQTQLLKYMRESAIKHFSDDRAASQAVITVPAYFGEKERQSVLTSSEMAGIEVIQLINEPTAAGIAYGINEKQSDRLVNIMDFGGGTFDSSLISFSGGEANVLASNGDKHLGGKDVDAILMKMICDAFHNEHSLKITQDGYPAEFFTISEEIIRQKHMLSSRTEVKICANVAGKQVIVPVTRQKLGKATESIIEKIETITIETIKNAKADLSEIKHVLPVGGSSRLVPFQDMIKRVFGKDCIVAGQVSPDLAIAEGAVIHAAKLISSKGTAIVDEFLQAIPAPAIKHTDVMPHSLGVSVQDRVSSATYCSVILERNTPIPCKLAKMYASVDDHQTKFKVTVVQGENEQPIEDCLVVGEKELEFSARNPSEPSIEVNMGYDTSGMVVVSVRDLISNKTEDIAINFYAAA